MKIIDHSINIQSLSNSEIFDADSLLRNINFSDENGQKIQKISDITAKNINATSLEGKSLLHLSLERIEKDADFKKLVYLLLDKGANVNQETKTKVTPLWFTLWYHFNDKELISKLVLAGADTNKQAPYNGDIPSRYL